MTWRQVAALVAATVLLFWMLGAHNRLVTLRNAVGAAWQQLAAALRQRDVAVDALVAALPAQPPLRSGLADAQARLRAAIAAIDGHPVASIAAAAALRDAGGRLAGAMEAAADAGSGAAVAAALAAIDASAQQIDFARRLFNAAAAAYNDAAQQFPTRLLTPMFSFGVAGGV